jgi:hypothetical protein
MKGENAETVTVHVESPLGRVASASSARRLEAWSTGARRTDERVWRQHGMTVMRRSWQCFKGSLSPTPEQCMHAVNSMHALHNRANRNAGDRTLGGQESSSCPVQVGSQCIHVCHDINAHLIMSACLSCRSSIHRVECTERKKVILP